jgi:hypothetical protein
VLADGSVFPMLRQQVDHGPDDDRPNRSLADYIAPPESGPPTTGGSAVTAGLGGRAGQDVRADLTTTARSWSRPSPTVSPRRSPNGSTARSAALVRARRRPPDTELIQEQYRGIRPFGYPACPDHREAHVVRLLGARDHGMTSRRVAMTPARRRGSTRPPASSLLQRGPAGQGSGRGLRPAQGSERRRNRTVAPREPGVRTRSGSTRSRGTRWRGGHGGKVCQQPYGDDGLWHPFADMAHVEERRARSYAARAPTLTTPAGATLMPPHRSGTATWVGAARSPRRPPADARAPAYSTFGDLSNPPAEARTRVAHMAPVAGSKVFLTSGGLTDRHRHEDGAALLAAREEPQRAILIRREKAYTACTPPDSLAASPRTPPGTES